MKKLYALLAVVIVIGVTSPSATFAQRRYCYDALVACSGQCRQVYGSYSPIAGWCEIGCSIGYLAC
jgi:hypothetical protein